MKKTLAKAETGGAKVILPAMDIGKNGIIGIFIDPAGAMLGVWRAPAKKTAKKVAEEGEGQEDGEEEAVAMP